MTNRIGEALPQQESRRRTSVREYEMRRIAEWMPGEDPDAVAREA